MNSESVDPLQRETALVLAGTFGLEDAASMPGLEGLRHALALRIAEMLDREWHLLMSLLYRIDVDERRVRDMFAHRPPAQIPNDLAVLIIERQLQKIRTRLQYREPEP